MPDEFIFYLSLLLRELEDKLKVNDVISGGLDNRVAWESASEEIGRFFESRIKQEVVNKIPTISDEALRDWSVVLKNKKPKNKPNDSKLSIVAYFLGYTDWETFCNQVDARLEHNGQLFDVDEVNPKKLHVGQEVIIGWYPDYYVRVRYEGDYQFRILNTSRNIKRIPGDSFEAAGFKIELPPVWSCNYELNKYGQRIDNDGNTILGEDLASTKPKIKASGVPRYLTISLIPVNKNMTQDE